MYLTINVKYIQKIITIIWNRSSLRKLWANFKIPDLYFFPTFRFSMTNFNFPVFSRFSKSVAILITFSDDCYIRFHNTQHPSYLTKYWTLLCGFHFRIDVVWLARINLRMIFCILDCQNRSIFHHLSRYATRNFFLCFASKEIEMFKWQWHFQQLW